jgi:membrane-bound serine protease (ClpP class)
MYRPVFTIALLLGGALGFGAPAETASIYKLTVNEIIHRISAKYVTDGIDRADREGAELVLIQLQTPGGLDTSMREIIEKILNSKTPVVVYVAPSGARAASAGFVITLAADVAAMAPGTNIGAAHPVSAGGEPMDETMSKKVESDAAAYVRSLAAKRGRNVELAEKGVVESQSWTESEALEAKLIDYVAADEAELLATLDGKTVTKFDGRKIQVSTAGQPVLELEMSWPQKVLSVISHPNIAYILMAVGMLGLYFELANPGAVLPGVIGAISLILAFFALQVLPVNYAGLLLILVGIGLMVAEAFTAGFGAMGVGGLIALFLGSLILFDQPSIPTPALRVSWSVLIPVAAFLALMFGVLARLVIIAQRRKAATGQEGLIGEVGVAETDFPGEGKVFVHGEYWNARSKEKLAKGERVRITKVDGLVVTVEPVREVS